MPMPEAENWTIDQYKKARAIADAPDSDVEGISAEQRADLRAAADWYERNMLDEPAGASLEPMPGEQESPAEDAAEPTTEAEESATPQSESQGFNPQPNPLAPDYYDEHPLQGMASAPKPAAAPVQQSALGRFADNWLSGQWLAGGGGDAAMAGYAPDPSAGLPHVTGDEPVLVGARNPFGGGDEAIGFGSALYDALHGTGVERQAGRGFSAPMDPRSGYERARDAERAAQAKADAATGADAGMYRVGRGATEFLATSPSMMLPAGAGAGALKTIGSGAATGAGYGGVSGALDSDAEGLGALASDTALGAAKGGAVGGLTAGALTAGARGLRAAIPMGLAGAGYGAYKGATEDDESVLGGALKYGAAGAVLGPIAAGTASMLLPEENLPGLQRWGRIQRAGAPGAYGSGMAEMIDEAKNSGKTATDAMADMGAEIERLGLDKQQGWKRFLPWKSVDAYNRDAITLQNQFGSTIGSKIDEATAQGVSVPRQQVVDDLLEQAAAVKPDSAGAEAQQNALFDLARRVEANKSPQMSPRELFDLKKQWETQADFSRKAQDFAGGKTMREAAAAPRSALHEAMGMTPPVAAPGKPMFGPEFPGSDAATIPAPRLSAEDLMLPAPPRIPRESRPGAPMFGPDFPGDDAATIRPPAPVAPIGAPSGYVSPEQSRDFFAANRGYPAAKFVADTSDKRAAMNAGNQQFSLLETTAGAPGALAVRASRMGGKDMAANAARGLVEMAQSRSALNPWAPAIAGLAGADQRQRPQPPAPPSPVQYPALQPDAAPMIPQASRSPADRQGETRGQALPDTIRKQLEQDPGALGDYGPALQRAIDSGDELRLNAEIAKLQQDPKFRQRYGEQLVTLTGGAR